MLSIEAESILTTARMNGGEVLIVRTPEGVHAHAQVGGQEMGAGDEDLLMAHVDAVYFLASAGLLRPVQARRVMAEVFELTTSGRRRADALIAERELETRAPDTCTLSVNGEVFTVEFAGVHLHYPALARPDDFPVDGGYQINGKIYFRGHDGWFAVTHAQDHGIFVMSTQVPDLACFQDRDTVSRTELHVLLKRPGLRAVREYLRGHPQLESMCVLAVAQPEVSSGTSPPATLNEYLALADDPLPAVLADCEQDILRLAHQFRQERRRQVVTALGLGTSPGKRRFYNVRDHIQLTLDDLRAKELIRTANEIQYELEVSRLGDVRRLLEGMPSDQLFEEQAQPQPTVYVPRSSDEFDAFLCHASEDKEAVVRPFAEMMADENLRPWLDEVQVGWGDNLAQQIQEGLSKSKYVAVFLSTAFLSKKHWTDTELNTALSMGVGRRRFVLPIVLGITHEELQARYPLVAATVYQPVAEYNPAKPVGVDVLRPIVAELKKMIARGT